ncbi:MAG: hypothetical protein D6713_00190 [Deltaproteobacteria bacterium]|nr:MAG: hypothetical protein D6713_00190 [Deltaproteobacteria bacterium]
MRGAGKKRSLGVALFFFLLLNWPLYKIIEGKTFVLGIPAGIFLTFLLWGAVVVTAFLLVRGGDK